jgi:hypothetical protein
VNVPPSRSSLDLMDTLAAWAQGLARTLLADALPRRWAHVQGVAARARSLAAAVGADAGLLEAAAWLHDIGYLPDLATTGLHGLDGARYLRDVEHAIRCCAVWSRITPAPSSRPRNAAWPPSSAVNSTCRRSRSRMR